MLGPAKANGQLQPGKAPATDGEGGSVCLDVVKMGTEHQPSSCPILTSVHHPPPLTSHFQPSPHQKPSPDLYLASDLGSDIQQFPDERKALNKG